MSVEAGQRAREKTIFGHPRGIVTLFMTEMWERFSFYGLRAILFFFLAATVSGGGLGLPKTTATAVVGVYGALVYLLALPGGWLADRVLGARKAVLAGGCVIMLGHICMAVPIEGAALVWLGLGLIVAGTGLLKPNISTMVGRLYPEGDNARRDAGFSIFYLGINLGAFAAPYVVSNLAKDGRWHLGFGAAAVGMAVGLTQYVLGARHLRGAGDEPGHRLTPEEGRRFGSLAVAGLATVALALGLWALSGTLTVDRFTVALTVITVLVPIAYFAYILLGSHNMTSGERTKMKAYVWLFAAAAVFWMIYDLAPTVLNDFAAEKTDLRLFGHSITAATTQSFNPLLILIFVPVFAALWVRLGSRVGAAQKFSAGLFLVGASFLVMAYAAHLAQAGRISVWWLFLVYLIQVFGELSLSPVGLSVTTELAPRAFRSQMLGVWFLSFAVGDAIGGQTARLLGHMSQPAYFATLAVIAVAAAAVLLGFSRRLRVLMGEVPA
ncbi:MFS transporter [Sphaerisporangium krabiense]|uniref:POT family proton-dependent oligopeptide transporter n=1 Tax=Sphaerisporangium krabiense TaxID=763782 RepID=A0A7W8ZBP9_9ACTN|nr:oligopeptide:H+ symporter [Sphaerisporangium krabiense]MBB5631079.1 POT family proton-dependent oligopeptide transporter [Sphaerisporangium krabiense]GII65963.1 MFS transporter [Sphaerisporangium krabiense]